MQLFNFHSPCLKAFFTIRKHYQNTKFVLFSKRSGISKSRIFLCRNLQNKVDTAFESPDIILFNQEKSMMILVNTCWLKEDECASKNIKIISIWNVYALISQQVLTKCSFQNCNQKVWYLSCVYRKIWMSTSKNIAL